MASSALLSLMDQQLVDVSLSLRDLGLVGVGALIRPYISKLIGGLLQRLTSHLLNLFQARLRNRIETADQTDRISAEIELLTYDILIAARKSSSETDDLSTAIDRITTVAESLPESVSDREELIDRTKALAEIQSDREAHDGEPPAVLNKQLLAKTFEIQTAARQLAGKSESWIVRKLRPFMMPRNQN